MRNTIDTMKDILKDTYRQIEDNLPAGEYLISHFTVYDKKNAVSTNLFLTNQAIFLQESNDLEKIKKRRFDKINDIKLTASEFYIEFVNGYRIIGDIANNLPEAERFFNDIKANTKIKVSSMHDLESGAVEIETTPIRRRNPFMSKNSTINENIKNNEVIHELTPTEDEIEEPRKPKKEKDPNKKSPIGLILGIIGGLIVLIGIIVGIVLLVNNKKPEEPVDTQAQQIALIKAKADELLQYQLDNEAFFNYIFELQAYYDEVSAGITSVNISEIESGFATLKNDFNKKYVTDYKTNNDIYAIYASDKIDSWMNNNKKLVLESFTLFEESLEINFMSDSKMITLQSKLTEADGEIRKLQTILAEEKDEVKATLKELTGEEYAGKAEDNSSIPDVTPSTTTPSKENTPNVDTPAVEEPVTNPNEDDDGFVDENAPKNPNGGNNAPSGRDDDAAYSGATG